MRTSTIIFAFLATSGILLAEDMAHDMAREHGGAVHHMFVLEAEAGGRAEGAISGWDLDGWIGTDDNKLWLKSEGQGSARKLEDAETWVLYSRNVATFWDFQAGVRHDEPDSATYAVLGFNGLAPYFFETEAHLFVSDQGDVSLRLRRENDLLLTQKLILQHYVELDAFAQDVPSKHVGAGLANGKIGIQTRYEFTRKFAPYVDLHYGRAFGETSNLAQGRGEETEELVGAIGLRLMF
jgi:copper resistance protein B